MRMAFFSIKDGEQERRKSRVRRHYQAERRRTQNLRIPGRTAVPGRDGRRRGRQEIRPAGRSSGQSHLYPQRQTQGNRRELSETRAQFEELENKINEIKKKNDEESEIHSFLNLVGRIEKNPEFKLNENKDDEYSLIQIPIIPKTNCYKDNFMDLFFCNKRTHLKCECKYQICAPTCCMCEECLKINQEYHKLNETNLINKAGRTAFCRYGKFHCLYQYKVKEEKNKNFFYIFKICVPENICEACNHLNINANIYLNEKILEELHFVQNSEKK